MYFLARWNSNEESGGGSTSLKKPLVSREKEACGLTVRVDRQVGSRLSRFYKAAYQVR